MLPARALRSRAQRSLMRGHGLCLVLRLSERKMARGHALAAMVLVRCRLVFLDRGVHRVQGSRIAGRAARGAGPTDPPLEVVGNGAEPDRLGAVLTLIVGDLARTWTKQRGKRGPTLTTPGAVLQPTRGENGWKP